jgi:hypothetical protein
MKGPIIDWITPKGQSLNPHIPRNAKACRRFHHEHTGALLCPTGYDWANTEYVPPALKFVQHVSITCRRVREKMRDGQFHIAGNQWPILLHANHTYDPEDPWNGLLRGGILVSVSLFFFFIYNV